MQDYFPACHHNTHVTGGFKEFPTLQASRHLSRTWDLNPPLHTIGVRRLLTTPSRYWAESHSPCSAPASDTESLFLTTKA